MARTNIPRLQIVRTGVTTQTGMVTVDNTNGMYLANTGKEYIHVKNTSASVITVTPNFGPNPGVDGLVVTNRTITVPATTGDVKFGPYPPDKYNQTDGTVWFDFSAGGASTLIGAFYE